MRGKFLLLSVLVLLWFSPVQAVKSVYVTNGKELAGYNYKAMLKAWADEQAWLLGVAKAAKQVVKKRMDLLVQTITSDATKFITDGVYGAIWEHLGCLVDDLNFKHVWDFEDVIIKTPCSTINLTSPIKRWLHIIAPEAFRFSIGIDASTWYWRGVKRWKCYLKTQYPSVKVSGCPAISKEEKRLAGNLQKVCESAGAFGGSAVCGGDRTQEVMEARLSDLAPSEDRKALRKVDEQIEKCASGEARCSNVLIAEAVALSQIKDNTREDREEAMKLEIESPGSGFSYCMGDKSGSGKGNPKRLYFCTRFLSIKSPVLKNKPSGTHQDFVRSLLEGYSAYLASWKAHGATLSYEYLLDTTTLIRSLERDLQICEIKLKRGMTKKEELHCLRVASAYKLTAKASAMEGRATAFLDSIYEVSKILGTMGVDMDKYLSILQDTLKEVVNAVVSASVEALLGGASGENSQNVAAGAALDMTSFIATTLPNDMVKIHLLLQELNTSQLQIALEYMKQANKYYALAFKVYASSPLAPKEVKEIAQLFSVNF